MKQGQGSSNTQSPQSVGKAISLLWAPQPKRRILAKLQLSHTFLKLLALFFLVWHGTKGKHLFEEALFLSLTCLQQQLSAATPSSSFSTTTKMKQGQGSSNAQSPQSVAKAISLLWVSQPKRRILAKLPLFTHFFEDFSFDFLYLGMGPGAAHF